MLVADVVRRVRESAGDTSVLQFTNSTLVDWINDAQRECTVENSLLQATATSNTVIGQQDYVLPTDIFKLHSVWVDGYKLEVLTLEQWEVRNAGQAGAIPTAANSVPYTCYVYAGTLNIWPKPSEVKTLTINYTKLPASVVYTEPAGVPTYTPTTLSIPEAFHNRIVTYCLAQVAMQDDNQEKYQALMAEFVTGVRNISHQRDEDDLYPFISVSSRDEGDHWYNASYVW